jgi:ABC-type phosphate transport system auxiliary subunit
MTNKTHEQLVAEAKEKLISGKPKATKNNTKAVEAADPILANELFAELAQVQEQLKALKAKEDELKDIIRDAIGEKDELHIHGAKVASISRWRETAVVTDAVKDLFPLLDYPELYKRTSKTRLNIH